MRCGSAMMLSSRSDSQSIADLTLAILVGLGRLRPWQRARDEAFRDRPLDRARKRVLHGGVLEAQLPGRARAVVAVTMEDRPHPGAAHGWWPPAQAVRGLGNRSGRARHR